MLSHWELGLPHMDLGARAHSVHSPVDVFIEGIVSPMLTEVGWKEACCSGQNK